MWHKVEYEATETPLDKIKKALPDISSDNWYWNWTENGTMKVMFRHQKDADIFKEFVFH
jgi:hypothetical protein